MKSVMLKTVFFVVGLAVLFAFTPLANAGEGGPPGDSKYAPPPYKGLLTITYDDPFLCMSGELYQMNSGQCIDFQGTSIAYTEFFPAGENPIPFIELSSKDLQGIFFTLDTAERDYNLQVLGVGKLNWVSQTEFSAEFIMMECE